METNYTVTRPQRWVDCTTGVGDVKNVTFTDKVNGVICADTYPAAANDPLYVRGTLNITVGTGLSYLGNGANGNLCMPTIYPGGTMNIKGTGSYAVTDYMRIPNDINNQGVLSFQDIGLFAASTNDLTGGGTLNLTNVRVVNNLLTYEMFGNINGQTINLDNSDINIFGTYNNVTINCSSTGKNYIGIPKITSATNLKIRGWGANTILDFQDIDVEGHSYDPATGLLTVSNQNMTKTAVIDIGLGYDPNSFKNQSTAFGVKGMGLIYSLAAPCFLENTMIETPDGARAVQDLKTGDLVWAVRKGAMFSACPPIPDALRS
ncbi:Hint domain-containing protein [Asaia lannensis]|uniref:Hint domain-containing protein n=1 Tax=Asaia lannensis TaxID=415421 RepID=UPI001C99A231